MNNDFIESINDIEILIKNAGSLGIGGELLENLQKGVLLESNNQVGSTNIKEKDKKNEVELVAKELLEFLQEHAIIGSVSSKFPQQFSIRGHVYETAANYSFDSIDFLGSGWVIKKSVQGLAEYSVAYLDNSADFLTLINGLENSIRVRKDSDGEVSLRTIWISTDYLPPNTLLNLVRREQFQAKIRPTSNRQLKGSPNIEYCLITIGQMQPYSENVESQGRLGMPIPLYLFMVIPSEKVDDFMQLFKKLMKAKKISALTNILLDNNVSQKHNVGGKVEEGDEKKVVLLEPNIVNVVSNGNITSRSI